MAKDIEEFLKMAAARRREAQPSAPATPPRQTPQKTPPKQKKQPARPSLVVSESEVEIVPTKRESVAKHVESHIDTSRLKKHAEKLGEKVGRADDVLEARLHQTFDHQIGRLVRPESATGDPAGKPKPPTRTASSLLAMMASQHNVQQAIVMSEILKRPEWD